MSNLELISYKEYPHDQYTKAVCTIRIDGKHCVSYGKKMTKQGNEFWAPATHNVTENGEKKYVEGYLLDSRMEEREVMEFVRNAGGNKLPRKAEPSVFGGQPISMSEAAESQSLPF